MSVQLKLNSDLKGDGVATRGGRADPTVERCAATGTVVPPTAVSRGVDNPRAECAEHGLAPLSFFNPSTKEPHHEQPALIRTRIQRFLRDGHAPLLRPRRQCELEAPELKMRIDVSEKDNAYVVKADIPGVKKEDINVRIDGNVVQIDAELKR
jgi:hypothetical protein